MVYSSVKKTSKLLGGNDARKNHGPLVTGGDEKPS